MLIRSTIVLALAALTILACRLSPESRMSDECGVVMQLPASAGRFTGEPVEISKKELDTLPSDTGFARMEYRTAATTSAERDRATVSIILAGSQRRSIHRPEVCLAGQGWTVVEAKTRPVTIGREHELMVRDLLVEKPIALGDGKQHTVRAHYVYWFVGTNVSTPSNFQRVWLSTRDALLRNVNHRWAYPSVMALVTDSLDPKLTGERQRDDAATVTTIDTLISDLAPQFQKSFMRTEGDSPSVAARSALPH